MCKAHRTQNFRAPRHSWYSFGDVCRPFQPSHLKNHEFHFFTKLPTKPSSYAVVRRPTWPCAKPTKLKTFVHQHFHGLHLGAFGGQSNPRISKTTNFNFTQNSPPSHLAMPWRTDQLGHVQNPPNSKLLCTKTFMVFIGDNCRHFQPSHLKNHEFHFFTKLPTKPSSYAVVRRLTWPCAKPTKLKTFVHQHFHGLHLGAFGGQSNPRISKTTNFNFTQNSPPSHLAMPWRTDQLGHVQNPPNSKLLCTKTFMVFIGDNCRHFQPSHLKNHEFHFFTKLPTKPSSYAVVRRPTWPCAQPTKLKTFVHQHFHGLYLGAFGGQSNPRISKTTNFNFSQNSPPSHLAMPWRTDQLGHVQNPPNSKLLCTKTFMVFIWGQL